MYEYVIVCTLPFIRVFVRAKVIISWPTVSHFLLAPKSFFFSSKGDGDHIIGNPNRMATNIEAARREANLRLLQRSVDPTISSILGSATHVVLYDFQQSSQAWEKSNVEGSLFLAVKPTGYLLVILNRNSPENYPIQLSQHFELQHSDPYLIFKQPGSGQSVVIKGIWFPSPKERVLMNDLLNKVLQNLKNNPPPPAPAPAPKTEQGALFAALLSPSTLAAQNTQTSPVRQASPSQHSSQPVLDKKSLQLALLSLIQDERFLDLLHAQYLKVAHARANRNNSNT